MRSIFLIILSFCLMSISGFSQLRLPSILSSDMVLQQNDSATFWGWGYTGQQVGVAASWDSREWTTTINNMGRWQLKIKTPAAGGPYAIRVRSADNEIILGNVMVGEVWLCSGQSNMEWSYFNGAKFIKEEFPTAFNDQIHFFQVPRFASEYPQENFNAQWKICDSNSLKRFSAVGYFFGKRLYQELGVPIGLINSSWGGTPAEAWTPAESIYSDEVLKKSAALLTEVPWGPINPGVLYNGMLAPIIRFPIAGAIWYQGEANTANSNTYSKLLTTMIDSWRTNWNRPLPFYYVQIAPYKYDKENEGALVMEQQTMVMKHPGTGMVVITDLIDSVTNIHPSDKRLVGKRLADWALSETYKKPVGAYKSPTLKDVQINKGKMTLLFNDAPNGLMSKEKTVTGFYISGEEEAWVPADAKINKDQIILNSPKLKNPVYVRYGFGNTVIGNVFSKEGLPLCPFRTDTFSAVRDSAQ